MHGLVGFQSWVLCLKPSSYIPQQTCPKEGSIRLSTVIVRSPNTYIYCRSCTWLVLLNPLRIAWIETSQCFLATGWYWSSLEYIIELMLFINYPTKHLSFHWLEIRNKHFKDSCVMLSHYYFFGKSAWIVKLRSRSGSIGTSFYPKFCLYRVLGNCGPKVLSYCFQNMSKRDSLSKLGTPQMWSNRVEVVFQYTFEITWV